MGFMAAMLPALAGAGGALAGGASTLGMIATGVGGLVSALGAIGQANATANAAEYQAKVAENNATIARQNQEWSERSAITNEAAQGMKTRGQIGAIKAAQAASGLDVNSGSALDVRSSAAELGQLDAINIRANAARESYGYATQAQSYDNSAALERYKASYAPVAGAISAGSSLLSAASSVGNQYAAWNQAAGSAPTATWSSASQLVPSGSRYSTSII